MSYLDRVVFIQKNGQKTNTIFLVSKKFRLSRKSKLTSYNSFFELNPKSQIWQGKFREQSKSLKNGQKNRKLDFSEGDNFLRIKLCEGPLMRLPLPVISIEHKTSDLKENFS